MEVSILALDHMVHVGRQTASMGNNFAKNPLALFSMSWKFIHCSFNIFRVTVLAPEYRTLVLDKLV